MTYATTRQTIKAERDNFAKQLKESRTQAERTRRAEVADRITQRREGAILELQVALANLATTTAAVARARDAHFAATGRWEFPSPETVGPVQNSYLNAFRLSQQFRSDDLAWTEILRTIDDKRPLVLNAHNQTTQETAMREFTASMKVAMDELGQLFEVLDAEVRAAVNS